MSSYKGLITFLGTGTSVGVPVIGCDCAVCKSTDRHNNRTRSSLLFSYEDTILLIDSGPDLREQALRQELRSIDAVLYTHCHMDHVVGFDELRAFCWRKAEPLPLYGTPSCLNALKEMFAWAFHEGNTNSGYVKAQLRPIHAAFDFHGIKVTPLPVTHGSVDTIGYLFENQNHFRVAYLPDVKSIPPSTMALLAQLDILIIDALRDKPHDTHVNVQEALEILEKLTPQKTFLTHISHELDHAELSNRLPQGVFVAYDGLSLPML